ncbi:putative drug exporter of the RND superfamily [Micromonospora phaseoli]|uniref:Putative drug exporter of the RND superfamily n=1 Tax=Micromonospora phaseoli TaxID=1144548 RepID=A0A1H7E347_9ACTN|nr:MMPL family transporter [Micromonospora phaseoli]PZV88982.1 RND superfamily putative drug exporter [Micromonospora phaseoli]GIJ80976.1 membrane protein [Micromonospora phaseoli]SEK06452.1 putative drug exporter of the RND superfamily [Micromonospora phaseoli]
MLPSLARFCHRRRWTVLTVWLLILAGCAAVATVARPTFSESGPVPGSPTATAAQVLQRAGLSAYGGEQALLVVAAEAGVGDPRVRRTVQDLLAQVDRQVPDVAVAGPYDDDGGHRIAPDGTVAYAEISFAERSTDDLERDAAVIRAAAREAATVADPVLGLQVEVGGGEHLAEEGDFSTEAVGLLAAVVILLVAFGSVLAMLLPIGTALFGVGTGVSLVLALALWVTMPAFVIPATTMVAIGIGIDYALFIVTRYREGLRAGLDPTAATVAAMGTAGRAVFVAGLTVVTSLAGLLLFDLAVVRSLAIGLATGVLAVLAATATLLPALLGIVGRHVDRLRLPYTRTADDGPAQEVDLARAGDPVRGGRWSRYAGAVQRRPVLAVAGSLAVLALLSAPVLDLRLGFADAGNRSTEDTTRRAFDLIAQGFGPGANGPLLLVADSPGNAAGVLTGLADRLADDPHVAVVSPVLPAAGGDVALLTVQPATGPQDERTADLVHRLRDTVIPGGTTATVYVTGPTAAVVDFADYTRARLPVMVGAVLLLSFLLLTVLLRAPLVALKAVLVNLLSIGAAYGLIVAVFQWGWGLGLIGREGTGPVEAWVPMTMFVLIFGLSMDYEVFLLSRVREEYRRTGDNSLAVRHGLAATARVITAAAAIMIVVFGGFAFGDDPSLQVMGLGLAAGILIDATLVRLVLVPATMQLLGERNWWQPGWLARVLPARHR